MLDIPRIGDLAEELHISDQRLQHMLDRDVVDQELLIELAEEGLPARRLLPIRNLPEPERLPKLALLIDDFLSIPF